MSYAIPPTMPDPGETPEMSTRAKLGLLWGYVEPMKSMLFLGVALGLVGTAMELATPMVAKPGSTDDVFDVGAVTARRG